MNGHRTLQVWQNAHALAIRVYRLTGADVADRSRDLVHQVRRSSESIPDNIAEGRAGRTDGVYLRHIRIALGSAGEVNSQFLRLLDRGEWSPELAFELLDELGVIQRQLLALELTIKRRLSSSRPRPRSTAVNRPPQ